jgi:hypothetical protein
MIRGSHTYNELVEALLGEGAREQEAAEEEKSGGAEELHETGPRRRRHRSSNDWPGLLWWPVCCRGDEVGGRRPYI